MPNTTRAPAKTTHGPTGRKRIYSQHDLEKALHALRLLQVIQRGLRRPGTVEPGCLRLDMAAVKAPVRMFVREGSPRAEKLWASLDPAKSGKKSKGKRG